jgi:hypothetical protein
MPLLSGCVTTNSGSRCDSSPSVPTLKDFTPMAVLAAESSFWRRRDLNQVYPTVALTPTPLPESLQ